MDRRPMTDQPPPQAKRLKLAKTSSLDVIRPAPSSQSQATRALDQRLDQPPQGMAAPRQEPFDVLRDQTSRQEPRSVNPGQHYSDQSGNRMHIYTSMRAFRDPEQQLYLTNNVDQLAKHLDIIEDRLRRQQEGWTSVDVTTISSQERDQAVLAGRSLFRSLFALQDGQGTIHLTDNLARFAEDNRLHINNLSKILNDLQHKHQGWKRPDEQALARLREQQGYSLKEHAAPSFSYSDQSGNHVALYSSMQAFRDPEQQLYLTDNVEQLAKRLTIPKERLWRQHEGWTSVESATISSQERDQAFLAGRSLSRPLFALQDGQGAIHLTDNLARFSSDKDLNASILSKVSQGLLREHQGWKRPDEQTLARLREQGYSLKEHAVSSFSYSDQSGNHIHIYTPIQAFRNSDQQLYLTDNVKRLAKHLTIPRKRLSDGQLGWTSVEFATISSQERDQAIMAGRSLSGQMVALQNRHGAIHLTDNLARFAIDNQLTATILSKASNGLTQEHQGWSRPDQQKLTHLRDLGYALKNAPQ